MNAAFALIQRLPLKVSLSLAALLLLAVLFLGLRSCSALSFALGTEETKTSPDVQLSPPASYHDLRVPESPPGGSRPAR
ncbi:MAG: hypothetical protein HS115_11680 [Spirochaetales bacterium]|nr:hypothetical protein [Spirochaetales bacterium]